MHIYQAYLEVAGLADAVDHRYRQVLGSHTYVPAKHRHYRRSAPIFSRAVAAVKAWAERRQLANDLYARDDRLLADIGLTREDIPAVLQGTHVRQPESAPIEHPSVRTVRVTDATAGSVANDNEAQIAA